MKYLHEELYYQDLYDRKVVRECRAIEKKYNSRPVQHIRKIRLTDNLTEWMLAREIAVLWYRRQDTIFQWMLDDKIKEDFMRIASIPNSPCEKCWKKMKVEIKSFKDWYGVSPNRVIFILRCTACNILKGVYDNDEDFILETKVCPKCSSLCNSICLEESDGVYVFLDLCEDCWHEDKQRVELNTSNEDVLEEEFETDKKRFCIPFDQAKRSYDGFVMLYEQIDRVFQSGTERKKKQPLYDRLAGVKRMDISKVEKYLKEWLIKHSFNDFRFSKPDISKGIKVYFTVVNSGEDDSRYNIIKSFRYHLTNLLDNTNWFIMSERLECRLWIIRWKLRWIDNDSELLEEIEKKMRKLTHN